MATAIDKLVSLREAADTAKSNYQNELDRVAALEGPYCLGDVVEINSWAYRGKKIIVDDISATFRSVGSAKYRLEVKASGCVVGVNGKPLQVRSYSSWDKVYHAGE